MRKKIIVGILVLLSLGLAIQVHLTLDAARAMAAEGTCCNNLKEIGLAMLIYSHDHQEQWPTNFQSIVGCEGWCTNAAVFVCPRKRL